MKMQAGIIGWVKSFWHSFVHLGHRMATYEYYNKPTVYGCGDCGEGKQIMDEIFKKLK